MLETIKQYLFYITKVAIKKDCYQGDPAEPAWERAREAYLLYRLAAVSDPCWVSRVNQLTNGFNPPEPADDP